MHGNAPMPRQHGVPASRVVALINAALRGRRMQCLLPDGLARLVKSQLHDSSSSVTKIVDRIACWPLRQLAVS